MNWLQSHNNRNSKITQKGSRIDKPSKITIKKVEKGVPI